MRPFTVEERFHLCKYVIQSFFIDNIIMSKNVLNYITDNFVLSDPHNHSSHNIVYMSISVTEFYHITQIDCNQALPTTWIWLKATSKQIEQYQLCLNNKLRAIDQMSSAYVCTDVYVSPQHKGRILSQHLNMRKIL